MSEKQLNSEASEKLKAFMNKGTVRVFECGDKKPEYFDERPFFGLLPAGQTSFILPGKDGEDCTVSVGTPDKDYILNTENHRFFQHMENRFRSVRPDMTLFVIDPDVVAGRYATDLSPDRSMEKSMFLHIVEKLQQSDSYGKTPLSEEDVPQVIEAAVLTSNAFSSTQPVNVTRKNLDGDRNVSLVVGDNPDTLVDDMFYWIPGVKERMEKEGTTRRQLQQFTLYHEFGHALDPAHRGGFAKSAVRAEIDQNLARHRTECLADAHAVLQLARDYGNTLVPRLISDVRIENTMRAIERLSQQESTSALERKLDKQAEKNLQVKPTDSEKEAEILTLQAKSDRFRQLSEAGASLAYYTTGVADAAIRIADQKLADGSLMKMSDREVLDLADKISKEYGLTREEMTAFRMNVVDGKTDDKFIVSLKNRAEEAYARMPVSRDEIQKVYDKCAQRRAANHEAELDSVLGIVKPEKEQPMSEEQIQTEMEKMEKISAWKEQVFDKITKRGADKDALVQTLTEEKDAVRKASVKDPVGQEKFDILNQEFIDGAPAVLAKAKANQAVFKQLQALPAVEAPQTGEVGVADVFAHQIAVLDKVAAIAGRALSAETETMTIDEKAAAFKKDRRDFKAALSHEKSAQAVAAAIGTDKETMAKAGAFSADISKKANGSHSDSLTEIQLNFGAIAPSKAAEILENVEDEKFILIAKVAGNEKLASTMMALQPETMKESFAFALTYMDRVDQKQAKAPKIDYKKMNAIKTMRGVNGR